MLSECKLAGPVGNNGDQCGWVWMGVGENGWGLDGIQWDTLGLWGSTKKGCPRLRTPLYGYGIVVRYYNPKYFSKNA